MLTEKKRPSLGRHKLAPKPGRKNEQSGESLLVVREVVPAPPAQFSQDKNGNLLVPDACYEKITNIFLGPAEARSHLYAGAEHGYTLLAQVAEAMPPSNGDCRIVKTLNFALDAVASLEPLDGLEVMLCSQMVALHSQGMEFMKRTMLPEQTSDGIDCNVNRATRLLRTFAILTESLRVHRGGGQQKVIVEHVTVNAGGQAIVGAVNRGGRGDA